MAPALRLGCACIALVLGANACRQDDSMEAIRSTVTSAVAPPALRSTRWKLVQQVYRDREYCPIWTSGRKLTGQLQFRDDPYGKDSRVVGRMGKAAPEDRSECEQLEELAGG